jgi:hypothetical protein
MQPMAENDYPQQKFTLLTDQPAREDRFDGGGHQRSARALAAAIRKLSDVDGAIGLEGGWGSGKSSVVCFAQDELTKSAGDTEFQVFTFDLWAHGMHDIRRPLLEELVAWAGEANLLTKRKNEAYFLERIRDRTERITRRNSRKYNFGGIVAIVLAPVVPLALAWLSPFAFRSDGPDLAPLFWTAAAVVLGMLYLTFFIQSFRRGGLSNAISLSEPKSEIDIEDRYIRLRDPATTEFQRIFRELIGEIQRDRCRLVLVLDNIDRVADNRLKDVWAEVRSIFAAHEPGRGEPVGSRAITTVVPYDLDYVATTLAGVGDASGGSSPPSTAAEALIRKTFRAVVQVAPPISADWREYLDALLDTAFQPVLEEDQKFRLFKIFEIKLRAAGRLPTPRDIVSYVNELVLCSEEWFEQIPLEAIALYLSCRTRLAEDHDAIVADDLLSEYALGVSGLGSAWRRYVAALFYNIEPDHAERVMVEYRLNDALTDKSAQSLEGLVELPNFASALSDVVDKEANEWAGASVDILSRVASRAASLALPRSPAAAIWQNLGTALDGLRPVVPQKYNSLQGLNEIICNQDNPQAVIRCGSILIEKYTAGIDSEAEFDEWEGWYWMLAVSDLLRSIEEKVGAKTAQELANTISFPQDETVAVQACACTGDLEESTWPLSRFAKAPASPKHFEALKSHFREDGALALQVLRASPPFLSGNDCVELVAMFIQRLRTETLDNGAERSIVIEALVEAISKLPALNKLNDILPPLFNDGIALWHIGSALQKDDFTSAGRLVGVGALIRNGDLAIPQVGELPKLGAMGQRPQLYQDAIRDDDKIRRIAPAIADVVCRANRFAHWQRYALETPDDQLKRIVYLELVQNGRFGGFSASDVVVKFAEIERLLPPEGVRAVLDHMASKEAKVPVKLTGEGSLEISPEFIKYISENNISDLNVYGNEIDNCLLRLNADEWREAIEEETEVLLKLELRIQTAKFKPKAQLYRDAISGHLLSLLEGKLSETLLEARWAVLLDGLSKTSRVSLIKGLGSSIAATNVSAEAVRIFCAAVPSLVSDLLNGASVNVACEKLIAPLISADLPLAAAISANSKPDVSRLVENGVASLREALCDAARGDLSATDEEQLKSVYLSFGLTYPKQVEQTDSESSADGA